MVTSVDSSMWSDFLTSSPTSEKNLSMTSFGGTWHRTKQVCGSLLHLPLWIIVTPTMEDFDNVSLSRHRLCSVEGLPPLRKVVANFEFD